MLQNILTTAHQNTQFVHKMYVLYTLDTNTEDPHTLFKARTGTNP
jgi:hypothetical protein